MASRLAIRTAVAIAVATTLALPVQASAATHSNIEGLDVSHWQGVIDWPDVAGAGYDFAFAKATEGQTFKDPAFTYNRASTGAVGIAFGGYHFSRPDGTPDDAAREAWHFAKVVAPLSGDIYPVVDVEDSGGLSAEELIEWLWTFLDEFRARTGLKAMIYTGPYFWRTYMNDTPEFAKQGYPLLWVAHWGAPKPDVPANNWGGKGAAFWQYTNCGHIPGIDGCVDLDHYKGPSLDPVLID